MTKLYFGTNLKMYKTISEVTAYLSELQRLTEDIDRKEIELFVLPSYTTLPAAVETVNRQYIKLGAQNMSWAEEGQFTGEISPKMLEELKLDIVMAGHSERRHVFGENDIDENKKILTGLAHGFTMLLCVGETLEDKNYGVSNEILQKQLKIGLHDIDKKYLNKIIIGYEPVWAIGKNGIPASSEYAEQKHMMIKRTLTKIFGDEGQCIPVLYGGSVNLNNAEELIVKEGIDGLYVGRSAWQAENFNKLIRMAKKTFEKYNRQ